MKRRNTLLLVAVILAVMALPMKTLAKEELSYQIMLQEPNKGNEVYSYEGKNNIKLNPYMKEPEIWEATIYAQPNDLGIYLRFTTATTIAASEIGIKDLIIYKKEWFGWKEIGRSNKAKDTDTTIFAAETNFLNVVDGGEYKVSVIHYAIFDGVEHTLENEMTSIFWYEPK